MLYYRTHTQLVWRTTSATYTWKHLWKLRLLEIKHGLFVSHSLSLYIPQFRFFSYLSLPHYFDILSPKLWLFLSKYQLNISSFRLSIAYLWLFVSWFWLYSIIVTFCCLFVLIFTLCLIIFVFFFQNIDLISQNSGFLSDGFESLYQSFDVISHNFWLYFS